MAMHSKTSSVDGTANSSPTDGEAAGNPNAVNMAIYACLLCPRTFPSRQALGGHQNGHRTVRRLAKRSKSLAKRKPPVVRPPISTGTVRALRSATPIGRNGFTHGPAAEVQPGPGQDGHGSMTELARRPLTGPRGDGLPKPSMEIPLNSNFNHPYPKPVDPQVPAPQHETDLLRVWMPITWVGEGIGSENSSETTEPNPDVRASNGDEDGVQVSSETSVGEFDSKFFKY